MPCATCVARAVTAGILAWSCAHPVGDALICGSIEVRVENLTTNVPIQQDSAVENTAVISFSRDPQRTTDVNVYIDRDYIKELVKSEVISLIDGTTFESDDKELHTAAETKNQRKSDWTLKYCRNRKLRLI